MRSAPARGLLGTFIAMLALAAAMVMPQVATAEIDVTGVDAEIEDSAGDPETQAGAHPYKVINEVTFAPDPSNPTTPNEFMKDMIVETPPGLIGNPTEFPTCEEDQLLEGSCPVDSQIGTLSISSVQSETFGLYNMEPGPDQTALFGAFVLGLLPVYLEAEVRPEDNGINISSLNTPTQVPLLETRVEFWGVPASSDFDDDRGWNPSSSASTIESGFPEIPFLTSPTTCEEDPPVTRIRVNSWENPDEWAVEEFEHPQFTGCEDLDYRGELAVAPQSPDAGAPTGYGVRLDQQLTSSADSLATSDLKRAEVTMPEGVRINPAAGIGLEGCSPEEIGLGTDEEVTCPQASRIGTVTIDTPMLDNRMRGGVYQAAPHDNPFDSLLAIYLVPEDPERGVTLKLPGEVELDPDTGQITTTFDDNPRLPFTSMNLRFNGGERAILANPSECGTHVAQGELAPWSGNDPAAAPAELEIDGACDAADGFDPQLTAGTHSPAAGENSPFSLSVRNPVGGQDLTEIEARLPKGLLAHVGDVPLCDDAAAASGDCPESSRVGGVQVGVGSGGTTLWVPEAGKDETSVHLAGPYRGAPYSLSIVVPAQAGPLDLGTVVSRAPLHVDPETTEITTRVSESRVLDSDGSLERVVSGGLPTQLEGIPLEIRDIRVVMDREGFTLNPTDCSSQQVSSTLGSAGGTSRDRLSYFQASGCAALDYAPQFGMRVMNPGRRSTLRSFNPAMRFGVAGRSDDANISRAAVTLPQSIILDQSNIRTTCTRAELASDSCPAAAAYGWAWASSPLLEDAIGGPVYLVGTGSQRPLPDLVAVMDGEVRIMLRGHIQGTPDGRMRTVFNSVPDVPVNRFVMQLAGGADRGILVNSQDLCRTGERGVANFLGQNGKRHPMRPGIGLAFRGCDRVRGQVAQRQVKRRAGIRKAVRSGQITPAQARRSVRH